MYIHLAHRMLEDQEAADAADLQNKDAKQFGRSKLLPGENRNETKRRQIPTEVYMRRKELLDDVQTIIDILEPGLSRRRGSA